ncbi:MAG: DUF362 domain-containing protein, partial [Fibrobacterota bacterium]
MAREKVAFLPCASYDLPLLKQQLAKAVVLIGFDLSVFRGKKILLKPNLLSPSAPEKAVTTHPVFVRAAAELLLDAGAVVTVGDSPGIYNLPKCLEECGIREALKGLPLSFAEFKYPATLKARAGATLPEFVVAREVMECDAIVNLPKLKTHCMMTFTCAVKNTYGHVLGLTKGKLHIEAGADAARFARMLVEICYLRKPALSLVDAVVAMEGNGPGSGNPRKLGIVLAGTDPLAVDAVATALIGFKQENIPIFAEAIKLGFGTWDMDRIEISGARMEDLAVTDFVPADRETPVTFIPLPPAVEKRLRDMLAIKPRIDNADCTRCGECVRICPAKVMAVKNKRIRIDRTLCIRCFCCQEI